MKAGPSHAYVRLLRGQMSSERYVEILKRTVQMRLNRDRKRRAQ